MTMINTEEIGKRVADLRRKHNLTQEQLAEQLSISVKHCSECERGISTFSIDRFVDLSEYFDVSLDYLIVGETHDIGQEFPDTILNILKSRDKKEVTLLKEYLHMYGKLRERDDSV